MLCCCTWIYDEIEDMIEKYENDNKMNSLNIN